MILGSLSPKNSIELIELVDDVYNIYPLESLNRIWLTIQSVMNKIIKERGDNKFMIPHMNKDMLEMINQLPLSLVVNP
jgi:hypothetical protein